MTPATIARRARPRASAPLRWLRAVIVMLLAVAVLGACARIPLDGPVTAGQAVEPGKQPDVHFYPDPPVPGASPQDIVRGFLEAGTGTQGNYETAREYLTDAFATSWDATARVLVHTEPPTLELVSPGLVRATIDVVAEIGADGSYTQFRDPETRTLEFELQNTGDEWRIVQAEPGVVLQRENFSVIFAPFTLYFFDASFRYLVPDVRWYPNYVTTPTRIVQGLLGGPVGWLADGAVTSAFPSETVLRGPVSVEGTVAAADFSPSISTASTERFSLMYVQLRESLREYGGLEEVRMSVNGASLDVSLPPDGAVHAHAQVNPTPLVASGGKIGYLSGDSITPPAGIERLEAMLPNLQASRGTVSVEDRVGAFVTPSGVMAVPFDTGQPIGIDARPALATPSIDTFGYIWTVSQTDRRVHVHDVEGRSDVALTFPGLDVRGIASLQVSREGARVAAIVDEGGRTVLVIASVQREDGSGEPAGIGGALVLPTGPGVVRELTWVDETSVAMLIADAEGNSTVQVQRVGGEYADYGAVPSGTQIAGSNSRAGLRVMDASGNLWVPRSSRWQMTGTKIDFLITQA